MFHDYPSFLNIFYSSLFIWSCPPSHPYLESLPSRWIFMLFGGGSQKVGPPVGRISLSSRFCLFSHFMDPGHSWFPLNSAILYSSLSSIFCPCIIGMDHLPSIHHRDFFISLMVTFSWFPSVLRHGILFSPGFFPLGLSRRGIMRRSCVHDTGFCDCAGVGVSGAV